MKKWGILTGILLGAFSIGVFLWLWVYEPGILEDSVVTREGVVTDRAISEGVPYVTVEFSDGTAVCCWELLKKTSIPEGVRPGRSVIVTYGTEKDRGRCVFLDIKLEGQDYKR